MLVCTHPTMRHLFKHTVVRAALALAATTTLAPAQAGLVSGYWDPLFGSTLPGLSWALRADFFVPNSCIARGDGVHAITDTGCGTASVNNAYLRMFNATTDGPTDIDNIGASLGGQVRDFAGPGSALTVTAIKVGNGQVVGVSTTTPDDARKFTGVPETQGKFFTLGFSLTAPDLRCINCGPSDVPAELGSLEQILVTYSSADQSLPQLLDIDGNPVGVKLNGSGDFLGYTTTPVPEPATAAMALAGLGLLAALARRRRRA